MTCLVNVPLLRFLFATNCPLLEEIIANHQAGQPIIGFTYLKQLNLNRLPELKSICGSAMAFSSLESVYVSKCPKLKKLPLNSQSGKRNTVLIGEEEWWDQLTWTDGATKDVFSSKFIPFSDFRSWPLEPSYTYEVSVMKRYSHFINLLQYIRKMINSLKIRPHNVDKNNVRPLRGYTVNLINIIIPHDFTVVFVTIVSDFSIQISVLSLLLMSIGI